MWNLSRFTIMWKSFIGALFLIHNSAFPNNDPLIGIWKAVDNSNGTIAIIELYLSEAVMNGRILHIYDRKGNELNSLCTGCRGHLKNTPIRGMTFIKGLKKDRNKWIDGEVIDLRPGWHQGVVASCELALVGKQAKIFGYLGIRIISGVDYWDRVTTTLRISK